MKKEYVYILVIIYFVYSFFKTLHNLYVNSYIQKKIKKNIPLTSSDKKNMFFGEWGSYIINLPFSVFLLYLTWNNLILRIFFSWTIFMFLVFLLFNQKMIYLFTTNDAEWQYEVDFISSNVFSILNLINISITVFVIFYIFVKPYIKD